MPKIAGLIRFLLIERVSTGNTYWERDNKWIRREIKNGNYRKIRTRWARHIANLDHSMTTLAKETHPDEDSGWLSPQGVYHGCGYENHARYARYILKMSVADMEYTGWIHVDEAPRKDLKMWRFPAETRGLRITKAQRDWLLTRGHHVEETD